MLGHVAGAVRGGFGKPKTDAELAAEEARATESQDKASAEEAQQREDERWNAMKPADRLALINSDPAVATRRLGAEGAVSYARVRAQDPTGRAARFRAAEATHAAAGVGALLGQAKTGQRAISTAGREVQTEESKVAIEGETGPEQIFDQWLENKERSMGALEKIDVEFNTWAARMEAHRQGLKGKDFQRYMVNASADRGMGFDKDAGELQRDFDQFSGAGFSPNTGGINDAASKLGNAADKLQQRNSTPQTLSPPNKEP